MTKNEISSDDSISEEVQTIKKTPVSIIYYFKIYLK